MLQRAIEIDCHGGKIRGMAYLPDLVKRSATVLMLHGFTGQRMESGFMFVQLARQIAQRGLAAVTFDFRHSGESDGSFDQMLVSGEIDDALHVTRWLGAQPFVDRSRLGVLGFSLGGLVAACANARSGAYSAMVLVAPTTQTNLGRYASQQRETDRMVLGPHVLHPGFLDDLAGLDPVADVVVHPRPTLVVQGTADTAVTPQVAQQFIDAMKHDSVPVTVRMIDGADHSFAQPQTRRQLIVAVSEWLTDLWGG